MGTLKVTFDGRGAPMGAKFERGTVRYGEAAIKAIQATAYRGAADMENQGRLDISRAGAFTSARWQLGLRAKVSYRTRVDLRIRMTHEVFFWRVFEYAPTTIRPKASNRSGMLWIPLSFAFDVPKGMYARDYPKPLFKIERVGKPPLLATSGGKGQPIQFKFVGKPFVTIRAKWHLRTVVRRVVRKFPRFFKEELKKQMKKGR